MVDAFLRNVVSHVTLPFPCCTPEGVLKANNPSLLIVLAFLNKDWLYFCLRDSWPCALPQPLNLLPDLINFDLMWIPLGFLQSSQGQKGFLGTVQSKPLDCSSGQGPENSQGWRVYNLLPCLTTQTVKSILNISIFLYFYICNIDILYLIFYIVVVIFQSNLRE